MAMNMIDLSFDVQGQALPADYRYALWKVLRRTLPWLDDEPRAGIHGIRTVPTDYGVVLLARRARLTLRVPDVRLDAAAALENTRIEIAGNPLTIGVGHVRPLPTADTLYADFVTTGTQDELSFGNDIADALAQLQTPCRFICGRRRTLRADGREVSGYAVALHGLAAEASLRLQREGLGSARKLGCGLFVQHKSIAGLD